VAIELNFREFLNTFGKLRSHILSHMSQNVALALKSGAPVIVTSAAESVWHMRAGRELASLAYLCGMTREQAVAAVTAVPERLLQKSRPAIEILSLERKVNAELQVGGVGRVGGVDDVNDVDAVDAVDDERRRDG